MWGCLRYAASFEDAGLALPDVLALRSDAPLRWGPASLPVLLIAEEPYRPLPASLASARGHVHGVAVFLSAAADARSG